MKYDETQHHKSTIHVLEKQIHNPAPPCFIPPYINKNYLNLKQFGILEN